MIPPRFLDELRSRLSISDVIGKRIRLTRAGREFKACCPFHNEKSPSFYVNDDKQFFHCFGCGAHGSIIDFVMRHDNLSFPETVETLAALAGMQVPKASPEEIEKATRDKSLYTLMEDAAKWFEEQFRAPSNKMAFDYMRDRGVPEDVMAAYRIGYAPNDMGAMRKHLLGLGYTDEQMFECSLIKKSEKSREPYAFFRERVMFPVPDRRGRIVAFGGRILPDHLREQSRGDFKPPKYVNSSETPLFHKGKMLYGEPHARMAASEGQPVVVVEGYLDVIAAARAGFKGALAPMGTALTEEQIAVLWKIIPHEEKVPILCFDGDNAGRMAASRACERILPMLKPDHSAKIAFLPEGEDPDTLIKTKGKDAFAAILGAAMNLVDFLWYDHTQGKAFDTPESRAGLGKALEETAARIADRNVQHYYREEFRDKIRKAFAPKPMEKKPWVPNGKFGKAAPAQPVAPLRRPTLKKGDLYAKALLACLINNPIIALEVEESCSELHFSENRLDLLRQAVLSTLSRHQGLDGQGLKTHLVHQGFDEEISHLLSESLYTHASFARAQEDEGAALSQWREAFQTLQAQGAGGDLQQAIMAMRENPSEENENRLNALKEMRSISEG